MTSLYWRHLLIEHGYLLYQIDHRPGTYSANIQCVNCNRWLVDWKPGSWTGSVVTYLEASFASNDLPGAVDCSAPCSSHLATVRQRQAAKLRLNIARTSHARPRLQCDTVHTTMSGVVSVSVKARAAGRTKLNWTDMV